MDKDLKLNLSFTLFLQSCATDQCHPVQLGPWAQKWPPHGEQLCCWRCDPVWVQSRLYAGGTECHRMFDSSQCPGTMEQLHTQLYRWGVTTHTDNTDKNAYTLTSFIHLFVTVLKCFIQFTHSLFSSVPASVLELVDVSWCGFSNSRYSDTDVGCQPSPVAIQWEPAVWHTGRRQCRDMHTDTHTLAHMEISTCHTNTLHTAVAGALLLLSRCVNAQNNPGEDGVWRL